MEVGSPEWIEASLARLDDLEQQRTTLQKAVETVSDPATLRQHNSAIERLSGEIKSLYAQLESVAEEDEEDEDEDEEADGSPTATQGDDELSAPHFSAYDTDSPAAEIPEPSRAPAPVAADNPFSSPASAAAVGSAGPPGGFGASAPASFDDDLKPAGGGGKWVFLLVVLLGAGGVGGYFAWQNMQASKPADAGPTGPDVVIQAAEVPDDTEAPNAVQGGDATISPNANGSGGGGNSGDANSKKKKEEKKTKPIVLKGGDGPL
jgi:uncharacterized coiled-coil protein SlyX